MNYTIKKVSEMTGLSIPTIRYYDKEGLLPDLQRKESGYRIFSDRDLEAIDLIGCFKESGLTIREIRHFMSLIAMVKDTSLAANITVTEMFMVTQRIVARTYEPLALYMEVGVIYLLFCTVLTKLQSVGEKKLSAYE